MPEVRYQVPGVPPGPAAGLTAFTPHFNRHAAGGAQRYKYALTSTLGRTAIPAPVIDTAPSPDPGDLALTGRHRSSDAPPAWWPQESYQRVIAELPGAGMPVGYYSPQFPGRTTVLPVPAEDYRAGYQRDSARLSRRAVLNRVRQLPWWPRSYTAGDGSGNG